MENTFIDGEGLKDSWKDTVKTFVRDVNNTAQDISIRFITRLLVILQYVLYILIVLFVANYCVERSEKDMDEWVIQKCWAWSRPKSL